MRDIYRRAIVVDGSVAPVMDEDYVRRLKSSGVTALNWTVPDPWVGLEDGLRQLAEAIETIAAYPLELALARSVADIEAAKRAGRVALILGPQNALPAEPGAWVLRILHGLGVRIVQLTYNERNAFGTGAGEEVDDGLTPAGRDLIREMERVGIVLDLSHCGDRTTIEAVEASAAPVILTHVNARALHASPRNKTDEQLKAVAARGGVVGATLWSPMLRSDRRPTLDDFVRHVSYIGDLVGIDHVAIGTDHSEGTPRDEWDAQFGTGGRYPRITGRMGSWYAYDTRFTESGSRVDDLPLVAEAVARLGLSEGELQGVLGGNFLRVCRQVWGG